MPETAYRFESCRGHFLALSWSWAPVAQLDRALDYGSRGWGFESSRAHLISDSDGPAMAFAPDRAGA